MTFQKPVRARAVQARAASAHSPSTADKPRWTLPVLTALLLAFGPWHASAAEAACQLQPGAVGAALCEHMRQMQALCSEADADVRGHCQACVLAANPLPCERLAGDELASCRRARAAIERCVLSGPERVDGCLRQALAAQVRFSSLRLSPPQPQP